MVITAKRLVSLIIVILIAGGAGLGLWIFSDRLAEWLSGQAPVYALWAFTLAACAGIVLAAMRSKNSDSGKRWAWTLGAKLALGFSLVVVLMAGVSGFAVMGIGGLGVEMDELASEAIPLTTTAATLKAEQLEQALAVEKLFRFAAMGGFGASDGKERAQKMFPVHGKRITAQLDAALTLLSSRKPISPQDADQMKAFAASLTKIKKLHQEWQAMAQKAMQMVLKNRFGPASNLLGQGMKKADTALSKELVSLVKKLDQRTAATAVSAESSQRSISAVLLLLSAGGTGLALIMVLFLMRGISGPIKNAMERVRSSTDQVDLSAGQVSSASQVLAQGSSEQAAFLQQTSASIEEMASMSRRNADNAMHANSLMSQAGEVVSQANDSMRELKEAMEKITTASDETAKIIKTIDEIAFQTNLLALNAAVEAARAGEAGAGFAVVADEVRNLAMRAAEAAQSTAGLIEENLGHIKKGSALVKGTDQVFTQVAENSSQVAVLISEIASAAGEQTEGIGQISKAATEVDRVTQQVASNAEELAASSEELTAQSQVMKTIMSRLGLVVYGGGNGKTSAPALPPGQVLSAPGQELERDLEEF